MERENGEKRRSANKNSPALCFSFSQTVAGITGGPGVVPGVNVGEHVTVFEQGARHVAADIAGHGVANPAAGLLATVMLLRHLSLPSFSDRLEAAVLGALAESPANVKTPDLGGTGTTASFVRAVKERL